MGSQKNTKKLRLFDIVLFNVCCILSVDTIAAGAGMGVQGMTWRILGILFFFIPYGLATAELGSTWPKAGGIYVWTQEAFGNSIGMPNIQQIFWTIFALSSVIFLIPYLLMFPAVIKLRALHPNRERPYTIPFGKIDLWITVFCGELFILIAIFFFFIPPKDTVNVLRYELSLCFGVFATLVAGLLIHFKTKRGFPQSTPSP